jgi:hypothetical protein
MRDLVDWLVCLLVCAALCGVAGLGVYEALARWIR